MYRTTYTVVVLSEDPVPDADLSDVLQEADTGDYVASIETTKAEAITTAEMANALLDAGSDPEFFRLDSDGNRLRRRRAYRPLSQSQRATPGLER